VSELPEDARQAAVEAIIGEESGYCGPGYGTCGSLHVSSEHAPALADAALAAALPFLERATRDKIAAEPPFPGGTYVVIDARKRGPWGRVYRARLLEPDGLRDGGWHYDVSISRTRRDAAIGGGYDWTAEVREDITVDRLTFANERVDVVAPVARGGEATE